MESRQQMTCVPSVTRRFFARVLDQIIFTFLWIPLFVQVVADFWHYGLNSLVRLDLRYFFLGLGLQFIVKVFCLKIWGATPGKLLLSLRLVSARGLEEPLTWAQSLLRVAADGFSFFFGLGLFSFALLRYDRTHLSDRMAETKVVRLCSHSQWLAQGLPVDIYFGVLF